MFSIADEPVHRVAKFGENRCRDGRESVLGKKLDVKYNGRSSVKQRVTIIIDLLLAKTCPQK